MGEHAAKVGIPVALHDVGPRTFAWAESLVGRMRALGLEPAALMVVPAPDGGDDGASGDGDGAWREWLREQRARCPKIRRAEQDPGSRHQNENDDAAQGIPPGGAGMDLELVILPTNVSFMGIAVQEVPSDYKDPQGYFANSYFDFAWSHTTNMKAGVWHDIHAHNYFMNDYAEMGDRLPCMTMSGEVAEDDTYGWIAGTMNWFIPAGWNEIGSGETDAPVKQFCAYWQRFKMASDGTLEVEKLANVVQRKTNTVVRLNGEIVPLRPR